LIPIWFVQSPSHVGLLLLQNTSYVLIKAQIHERMGEWQQAKQLLTHAMTLPGVARVVAPRAGRYVVFEE